MIVQSPPKARKKKTKNGTQASTRMIKERWGKTLGTDDREGRQALPHLWQERRKWKRRCNERVVQQEDSHCAGRMGQLWWGICQTAKGSKQKLVTLAACFGHPLQWSWPTRHASVSASRRPPKRVWAPQREYPQCRCRAVRPPSVPPLLGTPGCYVWGLAQGKPPKWRK